MLRLLLLHSRTQRHLKVVTPPNENTCMTKVISAACGWKSVSYQHDVGEDQTSHSLLFVPSVTWMQKKEKKRKKHCHEYYTFNFLSHAGFSYFMDWTHSYWRGIYLVWHGALLSEVLDVRRDQVLHCGGEKPSWLTTGPVHNSWFRRATLTRSNVGGTQVSN